MHGYNTVEPLYLCMVEHSVTGAEYCTGANHCKALILLCLFRRLLTIMGVYVYTKKQL